MVGANQGFNQVRVLRNPSHIQKVISSLCGPLQVHNIRFLIALCQLG